MFKNINRPFGHSVRASNHRMHEKRHVVMSALLVGTMLSSASAVYAQQTEPEPANFQASQVDDIVVTAQKREESTARTALAISAFSGEQLRDAGVNSVRDLESVAPNVAITTVGPANSVMVAARGVYNADFNASGNPAVSTYIDGVYVGRTTGLGGALYDLGRVEVLRGPQGTLYGRNSTGGNINVLTAAPEPDFGAAASLAYGNYNDVKIEGMVNLPLTDILAVRGAFVLHRNDGYFDTLGTTDRNYQQADDYGARVSVLFTPNDRFRWRVSADKFVTRGTPGYSIDTGPDGNPSDGLPVFERPIPATAGPRNDLDNLMIRSRMDFDVTDSLSIQYIAGYQEIDILAEYGLTATTYDGYRPENTDSSFHEVNISYASGRLTNIAGGSYFNQNVRTGDRYRLPVFGLFSNTAVGKLSHGETESWGIFDQASFAITDALKITAGIRYSSETANRDASQGSFCPLSLYPDISLSGPDFFGPGCTLSTNAATSGKWSSTTGKLNLEYQVSPFTFIYGGVTTGFKSGGLNAATSTVGNYEPEDVVNYEAGIKHRDPDGRYSLNATAFFMDYTNIQGYQFVGVTGETTNSGGAEIYGFELDGSWRPVQDGRFTAFVTYTHAEYTEYLNAVDQQTGVIYPDISGNTLPHAPEWTARIQYEHVFPLQNGGVITPKIFTYWQSRSFLRELNLPIDRVEAYTRSGFNVSYEPPGGNWTIDVYSQNLEDNEVRNYALTALGRYFSDYNPPRTYGARVSYRY